jgi:streptogramin lyase
LSPALPALALVLSPFSLALAPAPAGAGSGGDLHPLAHAGASALLRRSPAPLPGSSASARRAPGATTLRAPASTLPAVVTRGLRKRAPRPGIALERSASEPYWACPQGLCEAIVDPAVQRSGGRWVLPAGGPALEGSGEKGGYDPENLRAAYAIPEAGGEGQLIALIDAYGYPEAEADLAKYRERYGLPPCTHANGCFAKVNQAGEEGAYPSANKGWEGESALDLDMASAACPHCHLLLVQAASASVENLSAAVDTAVRLGASEISNSYGVAEQECGAGNCEAFNSYYEHPGVLISASSGDAGYDNHYEKDETPSFPASSPDVVAVGGTALRKAANSRGWSESVWNEPSRSLGSGSGCSRSEVKPAWQHDSACSHRMDNDVAAVAACETPLSVYATPYGGWEDFCGTSAASPLFAGIEAHASAEVRALGARVFYEEPADLFAVTEGSNGSCTPPPEDEYFCTARVGYNGPGGMGAPDSVPRAPQPTVSRVAPNLGPLAGGTRVTIEGTHLSGADAVRFGTRLASELRVESETRLSATAPALGGPETVNVTVTTPAGTSAQSAGDRYGAGVLPTYEAQLALGAIPGQPALNAAGDIWVSEWYEDALVELSPSGALLRTITALQAPCTGALEGPFGLAVSSAGDLWVVDSGHDRLLELSPEGACLREVGSPGQGAGQFNYPTALAIGPGGDLYLTDTGNARVQILSGEGAYISSLGSFGSGPGQFEWPEGIAVTGAGTIYVSDLFDNRIESFAPQGGYLGSLPITTPYALAVESAGNLFAASLADGFVAEYNSARELVGRFSSEGQGAGQVRWPSGIALSGSQLLLADAGADRLERFGGLP